MLCERVCVCACVMCFPLVSGCARPCLFGLFANSCLTSSGITMQGSSPGCLSKIKDSLFTSLLSTAQAGLSPRYFPICLGRRPKLCISASALSSSLCVSLLSIFMLCVLCASALPIWAFLPPNLSLDDQASFSASHFAISFILIFCTQ